MRLARCTMRGCPVVYRGGIDRACPMHADADGDSMLARMAAFTAMAAAPGEVVADGDGGDGDGDGGDGGRRTVAS